MAPTMMLAHDAEPRSMILRYQIQPYETGISAAVDVGLMLEWRGEGSWNTPSSGSDACDYEQGGRARNDLVTTICDRKV